MANENEITITLALVNKIQGDLEKAKTQIAGFSNTAGTSYKKFGDSVVTNNTRIMSSVKQMAGAFGLAFGAIQLVRFTKDIFSLGIEMEKVSKIFQGIASARGLDASGIIEAMGKGFEGTVSKIETTQMAIKTLSLNLKLGTNDFERISQAAKNLADATGSGTAEAFNALTMAVGRLNPRLLSSYGIFMSTKEAQSLFTEGMSKAEQQAALLDAIISKMNKTFEGADFSSSQDDIERLSASFKELKTSIGELVANEVFTDTLKTWTSGIRGLSEALGGISKDIEETLTTDLS